MSLDRDGQQVTAFVPPGYERYVRVLNPIEVAPGSIVMWSDVVKRGGLQTSPWMQWDEVTVSSEAMPANNSQPDMGNPHPNLAKALIRVLDIDSSRYNFATWEGYAGEDGKAVVEFSPADRGMALYSGMLVDEKGSAVVPITHSGRVPMYWWPDDLHWCIGQDIYARSLIIGCDLAIAGRILADPELDAYLIRETDTVLPEDF
jgi:hypothetical protein